MKRLLLTLLLTVGAFSLYCQNNAEVALRDFDKIRIWGELKVFLVKGNELKARVETQGIPASDVIIDVKGQTLEIKLKGKIYDRVDARIYVTYNQIRDIALSAAASVSLEDTLSTDKLRLNVNTSSEFDGALAAETADVSVGQGSTVRLRGKVSSYEASVSTKGILTAIDLFSPKTYVRVATGGIAKVYASTLLEANVSTGGSLTYTGNPQQKNIKTLIGANVIEQ